MQPFDAAVRQRRRGGYTAFTDADGSVHGRRKRLLHPMEALTLPECPPFAGLRRLTAQCADCGAETVLFDNRLHGYDGAVCGTDIPLDFEPQMTQKFPAPVQLHITLSFTVTDAELAEICDGAAGTERFFSECFTCFTASARKADGKYCAFFEAES